ncbi:hypothetical protein QEJ31_08640 [Pigmentibacter sp. JX0631]|uniref:hypothetical protein n=1 Tax=Pigmentibacter sp. JX0631 TaxID=2976982 RepID=UPI002469BBE6|nr:hypothetical protein [Pigmentibacter sp. JX0631]WGL58602.1 hypothetical protein QEJ31_08640 [Pigmentibacter sp. JX0631]
MELTKPKKALRGLFTRTEPTSESETQQIETKPIQTEEKPVPKIQNSEVEHSKISDDSIIQDSTQDINKTAVVTKKEMDQVNTESKQGDYSITKIQYNFEHLKLERNKWDKSEYINFIHRIDNAQTEAFFLKGKLIGEMKQRFYEGNKNGWKYFCEEHLNMNYTTANQYIRVSEEFDAVTSLRADFGFEHFKALLPVPSEKRKGILETVPSSVSVKTLRNIISKTLESSGEKLAQPNSKSTIKQITENLEKIKLQLDHLNLNELEQSEKWSLLGAFQNLTTEMTKISEILSKSQESRYTAHKHIGATSVVHEEDYVS